MIEPTPPELNEADTARWVAAQTALVQTCRDNLLALVAHHDARFGPLNALLVERCAKINADNIDTLGLPPAMQEATLALAMAARTRATINVVLQAAYMDPVREAIAALERQLQASGPTIETRRTHD